MGLVADIGSVLAGVGQTAYNIYNQERNYKNQVEQQKYDRNLQQVMFQREDNAVQRRMADMKAGGINPILASGSSAQAGPIVNSHAPQHENIDLSSAVTNYLNLAQQRKNIAMTDQQLLLNEAKIDEARAQADIVNRDNKILGEKNQLSSGSGDDTNALIRTAFPNGSPRGNALLQLLFKMLGGSATAAGQTGVKFKK